MCEVWKFCQFSMGECALTTYRCGPPEASVPTDTTRWTSMVRPVGRFAAFCSHPIHPVGYRELMARARVLIVDDQDLPRQLLADELEEAGLAVLQADNGEVAWKLLGSHSISVVVTDKDMPQLDGLALIRRIRGASSEVPIVLFTGDESDETRKAALGLGATRVVTTAEGIGVVVDSVVELAGARSSSPE